MMVSSIPAGLQVVGEEMSETAVAAENPVSARRPVGFGQRGFRQRGQQFDEAEAFRRGDGERQVFGKARERVDDVIGAERGHVRRHRRRAAAGNHRQRRVEQADGDGDGEVGLLVIGHRQHGAALRMLESGQQQVVRIAGVGRQRRGIGLEILQVEFLHAQFVLLDNDEGVAGAVQGLADQVAGFATAADQVERFLELANAAAEAVDRERVLEALVLQQGDQRDDRI